RSKVRDGRPLHSVLIGNRLRLAKARPNRVAGQPPAAILNSCRRADPDLPVREKTARKNELARPVEIGPKPPHSERRAAHGNKSQSARSQYCDPAVFPLPASHNGTSPEANLN